MSFLGNYDLKDQATCVDMLAKLSASLANLVESGVSSDENVKLCNDVIATMQTLVDELRGLPATKPMSKATPKCKAKK